MKVAELTVGEIYKCRLSGQDVLVILAEKRVTETIKGKPVDKATGEFDRAGKVCIEQNGMKMFSLIELHDGQLIELTK